ncbi:hypothetical protein [Prosthecobacter sp.]|uniref:hypothetical protein n=1 Tax=Prosthecobacter sp. TaxID=1965333 RepID=UPI0037834878
MPATRTKTFRLSHALADALELRAKELGYGSATALVEALARYDCLCRSRHGVTRQWAQLPPAEQDDLDARLLARVLKKHGMTAAQAAKVDWKML